MIGAMITHGRRGESAFVLLNVGYFALAVFIAWGRMGPEPFTGWRSPEEPGGDRRSPEKSRIVGFG